MLELPCVVPTPIQHTYPPNLHQSYSKITGIDSLNDIWQLLANRVGHARRALGSESIDTLSLRKIDNTSAKTNFGSKLQCKRSQQ